MSNTSDVTVIGLGAMGTAIANALSSAGLSLSVWNRSAEKARPFQRLNAHCADSPAGAVVRSPVTIVCISDYVSTWQLFEDHGLGELLKGRTLIQFSTGSPDEARRTKEGADLHRCSYLDGALLAYPREIGHDALIAVAGDRKSFDEQATVFNALSTKVRYLGAEPGAAAALDLAVLSYYACSHLGLVHAAQVCAAEGVSTESMTQVIAASLASDSDEILHLGRAFERGEFSNPGASVSVYHGVVERILAHARNAGIDARIPRFASRVFAEGVAADAGDLEVIALARVLANLDE